MGNSNSNASNPYRAQPRPQSQYRPKSILKNPGASSYANGYAPYPPNYMQEPASYSSSNGYGPQLSSNEYLQREFYGKNPGGAPQQYGTGPNHKNSYDAQYPSAQDQQIPHDTHYHHGHSHSPVRHQSHHHHHHGHSHSPPPSPPLRHVHSHHHHESPKAASRKLRPAAAQVNTEAPRLVLRDPVVSAKKPVPPRDPTAKPVPVVIPRVHTAIQEEEPVITQEPRRLSPRPKTNKLVSSSLTNFAENFEMAPPIRSTYVPRSPEKDSIHIYNPGTLTVAQRSVSPLASKGGKRWYDHDYEMEIKKFGFRDE